MNRILLLTLSLLPLAACGGSADAGRLKDEAYKAMDSGDSAAALSKFDQLLASLEPTAPDYVEVAVARCQALAGVDGARAQTEFLDLAKQHDLPVKEYTAVAGKLQQAKAFEPAVYVMDAAVKRFPAEEKELLAMMGELERKATAAGDVGAASALSGLGYLGDDD